MALISGYLIRYGYIAIFLIILLEDFGIPVPGETALITAGILAGKGHFSIVVLLLLALLGAVLGDNIGYAIGYFGGRRLVVRYGRYLFITEAHVSAIERFFARYGTRIVMVARFVSGLRQLNGIIAGIGRMPWPRFLLFNIIGAVLWVGSWGSLAYFIGHHTRTILKAFMQFQALFLSVIGLIVLFLFFRRIHSRKHTR
jgi:membrane protein DedA with SNARE-associated domain